MKLKVISLLILSFLINSALAQDEIKIFQIYDAKGNKVDYAEVLKMLSTNDVIFLGELHNDPISHYFQLKIIQELNNRFPTKVKIGMEMFEADDQLKMDEYLNGTISESSFESEARLWNNYKTDYKPIIQYAKENAIPVIATNIPRRYASRVYRENLESLESLSELQKSYIAPLPISIDTTLKSYKPLMNSTAMHGPGSAPKYLLESQAIKDATMAERIANNYEKDDKFIHLNGSYHSDWKEGIIVFLNSQVKNLSISNLSFVRSENIDSFDPELKDIADFIILVDEDMMNSY